MKKKTLKDLTKKEAEKLSEQLMKEAHIQISKSPLDALTFMCKIAPRDALDHIQHCIMEILEVEIPKYAKIRAGHFKELDPAKQTIEAMFLQSMSALHEHGDLHKDITRTVEDAAQDIAKCIDIGVKRMLLGENLLNVEAYLDICASHAKLTAALSRLMVKSEEVSVIEAVGADDDAKSD